METVKWQQQLCPAWCSVEHTDDDHPEDWSHRDAGTTVPVSVREQQLVDGELVERIVEIPLVIGRWQRDGERQVWWHFGVDGGPAVEIAAEGLSRIAEVIGRLQGATPEPPD